MEGCGGAKKRGTRLSEVHLAGAQSFSFLFLFFIFLASSFPFTI